MITKSTAISKLHGHDDYKQNYKHVINSVFSNRQILNNFSMKSNYAFGSI